eukprot:g2674.t1
MAHIIPISTVPANPLGVHTKVVSPHDNAPPVSPAFAGPASRQSGGVTKAEPEEIKLLKHIEHMWFIPENNGVQIDDSANQIRGASAASENSFTTCDHKMKMGEFFVKHGYDFESNPVQKGLTSQRAATLREKFGRNIAPGTPKGNMICRCVRDGRLISLKSSKLVPGDLLLLNGRAVVPADCRIIAVQGSPKNCAPDLTGDTEMYEKGIECDDDSVVKTSNMVLATSRMIGGFVAVIVVSTGQRTVAAHVENVDEDDVKGNALMQCCIIS